jgi:hypothetical protein
VCPYQIEITLFTVGNTQLMHHRVGFKINPDRAAHVLVTQDRPPEQVDDGISAGVQLLEPQFRQTIAATIAVSGDIGPVILETKAAQQATDVGDRKRAIVGAGVKRPHTGGFYIVHLISQAA